MNKREEILQQIKNFKVDSASSFLLLLISVDIVFIAVYFFHVHSSIFELPLFSITLDRGYSEIYQYIKEFWMILLIVSVFLKTKDISYISWAILFTYMLFDDAFFLHERVGDFIAESLAITSILGIELQHIGELAFTILAALLMLVLIGFFYLRGSNKFRDSTRDLLILLFVIAFFGVFVDFLHSSLDLDWRAYFILDVLEDGGEMIAVSLTTWYVFHLNARKGAPDVSIFKLLKMILARETR